MPDYTDAGTGTYVYYFNGVDNDFPVGIICNGDTVDVLNFPTDYIIKEKEHFKDGEQSWWKGTLSNILYTSKITGEIFKGTDFESGTFAKGQFTWNLNLNGNMGNHYIIHMVFDVPDFNLIKIHSVCH